MLKKKKTASGKRYESDLKLVLTNTTVQAFIFILVTLASFLVGVNNEIYFIISLISLCLGNFLTGFISGRTKKQKGLLYGALYSLLFNVIIITISVVFNSFSVDYTLIISALVPAMFSCVGGIIAVNLKRKSNIKR